eukprot:2002851-Rhodomonas_salina.1
MALRSRDTLLLFASIQVLSSGLAAPCAVLRSGMLLRACYCMCGTEVVYGGTSTSGQRKRHPRRRLLFGYPLPPSLLPSVLGARYTKCCTALAYRVGRYGKWGTEG